MGAEQRCTYGAKYVHKSTTLLTKLSVSIFSPKKQEVSTCEPQLRKVFAETRAWELEESNKVVEACEKLKDKFGDGDKHVPEEMGEKRAAARRLLSATADSPFAPY